MLKIRLLSREAQIHPGAAGRELPRKDENMINCLICGKEVSDGWVTGLPPAPDSQKVGLCAEHNTPENRAQAEKKWRGLLERAVLNEQGSEGLHHFGANVQPLALEILFIDGGKIEVACKSFRATDEDVLEVITPEGRLVFYPLRHIRRYGEK